MVLALVKSSFVWRRYRNIDVENCGWISYEELQETLGRQFAVYADFAFCGRTTTETETSHARGFFSSLNSICSLYLMPSVSRTFLGQINCMYFLGFDSS